MYTKDYYEKLTSDIARKVTAQLVEELTPIIKGMPDMPILMKFSQASKATGLSITGLRTLYHEGVITGKHTGTAENSPILLHTSSLMNYLAANYPKDDVLPVIKKLMS